MLLYGMALHNATDTFAHSAYENGKRVTHPNGADNTEHIPDRYDCAKVVAKKLLLHAKQKEKGRMVDWVIPSNTYANGFKLIGSSEFAEATSSSVYKKK